jgi:hypothetical protein
MMGADIHLFLERKMKSGNWACVSNLDSIVHLDGLEGVQPSSSINYGFYKLNARNYQFFGRIASVRGEGRDPQGLPIDASDIVEEESHGWGMDGHSHSWLSASDFVDDYYGIRGLDMDDDAPMSEYHQRVLTDGKDVAVLEFLRTMCNPMVINLEQDKADDYRFVFWFDN